MSSPAVVVKKRSDSLLSLDAKRAGRPLGDGLLSLVDQAIVSGTNFLTTILIGRAAGETQLGLYALGLTFFVLLLGAQESLVTLPYTVFRPRIDPGRLPRFRGTVLLHQGSLSLLASVVFLIAGTITATVADDDGFARVLLVLGATVMVTTLRDFVRRITFADLRVRWAIVLDLLVCVLQLAGIASLAQSGFLTAVTAHVWIGITCGIIAGFMLWRMRANFRIERGDYLDEGKKHWRFGSWLLADQMIGIANGSMMQWLLALMLGAAEAGIFVACSTPVFFANPLVLGIGNYLGPELANIAAKSIDSNLGNRAVRQPVVLATGILAASLSIVLLIVTLFGNQLLLLLFDESFAGHGRAAAIITLGILFRAVGAPPAIGLRTINRPSATFVGPLLTLIVSLSTAFPLISMYGVEGAGCSLVLGYAAGSLIRWILFWKYSVK